MKTVIFDIDGTLADLSHRIHHIEGDKKNWQAFHEDCPHDDPIDTTIQVNNALYNAGHNIVLMTGREEQNRIATIEWCHKHSVKFHHLLMRKTGNRQQDTIVKAKLYASMIDADMPSVLCVFEDRNRAVQMWRDLGITCYHVTDGDY